MKNTKDKRLTFTISDSDQIAIAAACEGKSGKQFMQDAVISATIMTINKYKSKKK